MVAGVLSGLFGIGGGAIIVPALVAWTFLDQRRAHGTSLASVLPIAAAGSIGYFQGGAVDLLAVLPLVVGSTVGAMLGARLLTRVPERGLRLAFAAFLLIVAANLLLSPPVSGAEVAVRGIGTTVLLVVLGLLTGTAAGLLGIGGGVIVVPGLILLLGVSDVVAKGTSLALIVPTALVGTVANVRRGNAHLPTAAWVGLSGTVTSYLFAGVSLALDPRISVPLFAALLIVIATRMLLKRS